MTHSEKNRLVCDKIALLWMPVGTLLVFLILDIWASAEFQIWMVNEGGLLELFQFILLSLACLMALAGFIAIENKRYPLVSFLYLVFFGGALYIAGEEISWGQHFFSWETPDSWKAVNDQHETNLHNTSSWLDQKPRLILELGVVTGGLVLPWLSAKKKQILPEWMRPLIPPVGFGVTAGCFLFVKVFDKISEFSDFNLFDRASEVAEFYIYYFILLYLLFLGRQFLKKPKTASAL